MTYSDAATWIVEHGFPDYFSDTDLDIKKAMDEFIGKKDTKGKIAAIQARDSFDDAVMKELQADEEINKVYKEGKLKEIEKSVNPEEVNVDTGYTKDTVDELEEAKSGESGFDEALQKAENVKELMDIKTKTEKQEERKDAAISNAIPGDMRNAFENGDIGELRDLLDTARNVGSDRVDNIRDGINKLEQGYEWKRTGTYSGYWKKPKE